MHHLRKTKLTYNKANAGDRKRPECTFCTDETRARILDENKTMFVIANRVAYDFFEGLEVEEHLMVIPKRHIEDFKSLSAQEKTDFVDMISKYEAKGYGFYARGTHNANRSVRHQHTHLFKVKGYKARVLFYLKKPHLLIRL